MARKLYGEGSGLLRKLQHWRPYICPFDSLIDATPVGARTLDVGCGGGLLLGLLVASGRIREGYGFDASQDAIKLAQQMARRAQKQCSANLTFEQRDASAGFPQGQFDVVTMVDLMHHVAPGAQQGVFQEAASRVGPGGRLVYKDMAMKPFWTAWASRAHDLLIARERIHFVPMNDVREWAQAAGLREVSFEQAWRVWYKHELCVFERAS